ncbi:tRNA lysidine(34) synthetase TilS [Rhabdaerophilum sp. SD176]|uniref:tRNA lysidine(34) synthetase TilS n=1 Tax=Rhabdaerophilum sp. SD176 TaxID=2983548 RepID=UPI0024DF8C5B|nr:tRNA lysidine(34) synthetase TilS [Rhabdaerophilum sp. SD176]
MLEDDLEGNPIDQLPLTPEEALALFRSALGSDECNGILLAVSGGPDSMALLGLAVAARAFLPPIAVATVDHRLRPESADEARFVAEFCKDLKIAHCTLPWLDAPGPGTSQETARKGRYALLVGHARAIEATHLFTAHTLDDQAETVLMRMASGTGLVGLGAMRPNVARGAIRHVRPFLEVAKSRLIATCEQNHWVFSKDPTNEDARYARTRFRALIPILADEGLTPERLGTLAARARRTEDAMEQIARRTLDSVMVRRAPDGGAIRMKAEPFFTEPFEMALRMLKKSMLAIGGEAPQETQISLAKLERLLKNLRMAIRDQRPFRQTLAWTVIAHGGGFLEVRTAPPRRTQRENSRTAQGRGG